MATKESTAARAMRQLPELGGVLDRLSPESFVRKRKVEAALETTGLESVETVETPRRRRSPGSDPGDIAKNARKAVEKVRSKGPDAVLTPPEEDALEAIVLLEGRPALLVKNGKFEAPPPKWATLEGFRDKIEAMLSSVGRIEVTGHPSLDWLGTGFLVAPDVVMTNRHVAKEFCRSSGASWKFEPRMKARIDYSEEFGSHRPAEFALTDVIGVHDVHDLALFRVSRKNKKGTTAPAPIPIARKPKLKEGRPVYVVGFPAWDGHRNEPEPMAEIFKDIFNVKRLQPGEMRRVSRAQTLFEHDCSTLGGNSGSCVVDLETQRVTGLHFSGRFLEANYAVLLSKLEKDKLIRKAGVELV
jgi:V8-like Glu-specific endopeptidase